MSETQFAEDHLSFKTAKGFSLFVHPFRMLLVGSTGSGKSFFIKRLLENSRSVFVKNFDIVVYCFPKHTLQDRATYINDLKNACPLLRLQEGLPDISKLGLRYHQELKKLLILDDLISPSLESEGKLFFFLLKCLGTSI